MISRNYFGTIGAILVIAGGFSPMLRVPILGNWNYWDLDLVLPSIVYAFAAIGLLASVGNKRGLLRFSGWAILIVLVFTLIAVYFKVNDYFSFIPIKKLSAAAARLIHYKWTGWLMILSGSILMILGGRRISVRTADNPIT